VDPCRSLVSGSPVFGSTVYTYPLLVSDRFFFLDDEMGKKGSGTMPALFLCFRVAADWR